MTRKSKKKMKPRQNKPKADSPRKILVFLVKFFVIFGVLNYLIEIADLSFFTQWLASFSASALGLYSYASIVLAGSQVFVVSSSCTGLMSISILAAIIFSLKKPALAKKVLLFVISALVLLIVNVPRLIVVLYAAQSGLNAELVHELTWFLMSAIILLLWYYGTKRITGTKDFSELI